MQPESDPQPQKAPHPSAPASWQETAGPPQATPPDLSASSGLEAIEPASLAAAATLPFAPHGQAQSPGDRQTPQYVDKYQIVETIGAGGMGIVFKAHDPDLKRHVALKMMRSGLFAGEADIGRFLLEREAMARVKHPNVVPVYDAGQYDGQPYFVLAYLPGGSLDRRQDQYHGDPRAAVALVEKVAQAVHAMHHHDMLHRDLKPSNILFDEQSQPFLSDFGLIKLLGEGGAELTRGNQGIGTPAYMAPEQTGLVRHPLGPATDVWALGIILFELLTAQRPFEAPSNSELVQRILYDRPASPRTLRGDLDPGLEAVVLKCLEKDPRDRHATAEELADELARWLRGEPVRTRPDTLSTRLRRTVRRHPYRTALGAVLVAALILVPTFLFLNHPSRALARIERSLQEGRPTTLIAANGAPAWRERLTGSKGTAEVGRDGFFTLSSWDLSLWRLCKDPQMTSYRFRAHVRHEQAFAGSRVGLFVAHERSDGKGGPIHFCFLLGFNDLDDIKAEYQQKAPPKFKEIPIGNTADLTPAFLDERKNPLVHTCGKSHSPFFQPALRGSGRWRELIIDVSPHDIHATFDHLSVPPLTMARVMTDVNRRWMEIGAKDNKPDELATFVPTFRPRGSLGLFVSQGTAAFCDVTVEPLPEPAKEKP